MSTYHLCSDSRSVAKLRHELDEFRLEAIGLYLAPANLVPGIEMCAGRSPFCTKLCLYNSGLSEVFSEINDRRVQRTVLFRDSRQAFMYLLMQDLETLRQRALRRQRRPVARLNATSDWMWEKQEIDVAGIQAENVMSLFPDIQFYDYTKVPGRIRLHALGKLPDNYHLTFSLSETNDKVSLRALEAGMNLAVPMHIKPHQPPETFSGYPVVNGDAHDYRFLDPQGGYIVALSPKGKAAKKDFTSGFIKDVGYQLQEAP
jgi:hypothetical protein